MTDTLELALYNDDIAKLAFRFLHNVVFLAMLVRFAWHPKQPRARDRDFAFAVAMLNVTVFFICFTMKKLELSLGMALGLFAIFGVLRYRTNAILTKDMTYLFIAIGIAVINALANQSTSYLELLAVNCTIVGAAVAGEWLIRRAKAPAAVPAPPDERPAAPKLRRYEIEYDNMELLAPERQEELKADLQGRTHLQIARVRVDSIDLPNGRVTLSVWQEDDARESE